MTTRILIAGRIYGNDDIDKNKNLSFSVAQKMIHRLLATDRTEKESLRNMVNKKETICTKYTKEELAQKLGITTQELDKLKLALLNFLKISWIDLRKMV